jgi:hydroxymethylglutaryl-CoA synthase
MLACATKINRLMMENSEQIGVVGYGVAIPEYRIDSGEIAKHWKKDPALVKKSLGVNQKSVADVDEDAATLAIEAALGALESANLAASLIGAVYVGSESHPYAVKPTSTIVGGAIGVGPEYFAADLEFACKAGTAGVQIVDAMLVSKRINYGLAIGSDTAQGAPGDSLEYTAAAGAAAFILGSEKVIATLDATCSYSSDTPDFWRAREEKYPTHAGRFTGKPSYFAHVAAATKLMLEKTNLKIEDFDHVVFHMPNATFPRRVAKQLGVSEAQLSAGLIVPEMGNSYSAASLLGLAAVLDKAQAGQRILLTSYGSGAGSDSFVFTVTEEINQYKRSQTVEELINGGKEISYGEYLIKRNKVNL